MENYSNSEVPREKLSLLDKFAICVAALAIPATFAIGAYEEATDRNPTTIERSDPRYQACMDRVTVEEAQKLSNATPNIGGWAHANIPNEARARAEDICLKQIFPE